MGRDAGVWGAGWRPWRRRRASAAVAPVRQAGRAEGPQADAADAPSRGPALDMGGTGKEDGFVHQGEGGDKRHLGLRHGRGANGGVQAAADCAADLATGLGRERHQKPAAMSSFHLKAAARLLHDRGSDELAATSGRATPHHFHTPKWIWR